MWKTLPWMVTKVLLFFLQICSHEAYSGNVGLFLRRGWIAWTFWVTVNHPTCITNHWWTNYLLFFFLGFWGGEVVISKSVITPFVFQLTTRLLDNVSDGSNQCWETWRNWQEWVCLHFLHLIFCIYIYICIVVIDKKMHISFTTPMTIKQLKPHPTSRCTSRTTVFSVYNSSNIGFLVFWGSTPKKKTGGPIWLSEPKKKSTKKTQVSHQTTRQKRLDPTWMTWNMAACQFPGSLSPSWNPVNVRLFYGGASDDADDAVVEQWW